MSTHNDRGRHDRGRHDRGRHDRGRDDRNDRGSAHPGGRHDDRTHRDGAYNRRRSRSPGRDQQAPDTHERGDRRGGFGGRRGIDDSMDCIASGLPPLPAAVPIPDKTGAKFKHNEQTARGTLGRAVKVQANHYVIQSLPIIKIYQYELRFRVPESSQARGSDKITANQMARILVNTTLVDFLREHFVFDGVSLGWSPQELMPVGSSKSTTISLGARRDEKPNEVDIAIRNVGPIKIYGLVDYLKLGRIDLNPAGNPELEDLLKWLNALFREDPARRMVCRPGSNAFFQRSRETSMALHSTNGVLEALQGIFQTVQLRFSCLSLVVDVATTPFWVPGLSLIDCVCALLGKPLRELQQAFLSKPGQFFQTCDMLLGCFFNVQHLITGRNAKKMRLLSWSAQDSSLTTFEERMDDGTMRSTSVADYFKRKYCIHIEYPSLPLAHTRDGDLPLELCFTASGERYRGVLQGPATADLIKVSTRPAYVRRQQIEANLRILAWHQNLTLRAHGISVSPKMIEVNASVLDPPQIVYGSGTVSPRDGSWNLRGIRFLRPSTIVSWTIISFAEKNDRLQNLGREMIQSFRAVGMSVPGQPPSLLLGNPHGGMESIFRHAITRAEQDFGSPPDLIFIILDRSSIPMYHAIKNGLDIVHGIASQVMLAEKICKDRGLSQYLGNISMKINVKLGGTNSTIDQPLFKQGRWMLIGGDVSTAGPSALKRDPPPASFAALCCTYDRTCTSYIGNSTMQQSNQTNIIVQARLMFKDLLTRYKEKNNGLMPEHIMYLRDGVSEGEFQGIQRNEGGELHRLCEASGTKITIIVAIKRHHTRFFAGKDIATKLGNVPTGTVVENSSSRNDSYIIAHKDLIGTKRPTRYVSIVDENKLSADQFHQVIHWASYSYARSTTSVAVAPPIYYADQICERARLHLQDAPGGGQVLPPVHQNLRWRMYWQ